MTTRFRFRALIGLIASLLLFGPARLGAQSGGRIEFQAQIAPTGGQPEPVRQLTFYLLRKSLEEIRKEASLASPAGDLDQFIDGLGVSPELKAWMHKQHSVRLTGEAFLKSLTADDVYTVPEFLKAYMEHNAAYRGIGFPEPKFKEKDKAVSPAKYQAQKDEYNAAVKKFIASNTDTIHGIDLELITLDPSPKWDSMERKHRQAVDARAFQLAEQRYLAARGTTDLDGRGSFAGLPPGIYWIAVLGAEAISGDVRLRWDLPVTVRTGETASVELSNFNAVQPDTTAQNSGR